MPLQKVSSAKISLGSGGDISNSTPYACDWGITIDESVKVGEFVQTNITTPKNDNEVKGVTGVAITGKVLGVVVKDSYKTALATPTTTVAKGENVTILTQGSIFIETTATAKKGQRVFLNDTNGALAFDDKMIKTGHTYTGFMVSIGNASATRGIIEITTAQANTIKNSADITA